MDILCACPFAVATLGWEPAPGRRSLTVCVKATFVLAPGATATVAALQEPVRIDEAAGPPVPGDARERPPTGSGGAAPDLVPFKPRVDILFTGHAHAPGGAPTDSLIARARIGPFRKSLSINGDRTWVPSFDGLRPSVAVPFRRMPLAYERAVRTGENLTGVDISQGAELNRPLANIAAIADQGGETPGLGPIPLGWRALRLGLGDAALLWASRAGLVAGPPPPGFDFRLFNAAPAEQQVDELPLGPDVLLENLHPDHPRLETRLPALRVKLFRRPPRGASSVEVPVRCDTLWIDTDRGLAFSLWRAAVLIEGPDDASVGRLIITAEAEGERVGPAEVDRMLARFAPEVTYVDPASFTGEGRDSYPPVPDPIPLPDLPVPMGAPAPRPPVTVAPTPPAPAPNPPGPRSNAPVAAAPSAPPAPPALPVDAAPIPSTHALPAEPADEPTPLPGGRRAAITLAPPPPEEVSTVQALPFRSAPAAILGDARERPPTLEAPPPTSPAEGALPPTWGARDEDTEVTPARGYPSLTDLHAAPQPAPAAAPDDPAGRFGTLPPEAAPAPAVALPPPAAIPSGMLPAEPPTEVEPADPYCAVKMEQWKKGQPLHEVLARHGIDEASFRAHEAAQVEALGREAAEGRSDLAIVLLEGLAQEDRGA